MTRSSQLRRRRSALITLVAAPIGAAATIAHGREPIRSVANARTLLPDVLMSPRHRQRVTHRGWEIREQTFTIVANRGEAEARFAQKHFRGAWEKMSRLADYFDTTHRRVGFANNSTLVFFDSFGAVEGRKSRNYPVGSQFVIHHCPSEDRRESSLSESAIHRGATAAFLHASGLDTSLPSWFHDGLQQYISHTFTDNFQQVIVFDQAPRQAPPSRWVRSRSPAGPVELAPGAWVQFLLEADGGRYASSTFAAMSDRSDSSRRLLRLRQSLTADFEDWRANPTAPPSMAMAPVGSAKAQHVQEDLFTLLRLARRWSVDSASPVRSALARRTSMLVSEFSADQTPRPDSESDVSRTARPDETDIPVAIDINRLKRRFLTSAWSINSPGGGWLDERAALAICDRLQLSADRVELQHVRGEWTIRYRWDRQSELVGRWPDSADAPAMISFRFRGIANRQPAVLTEQRGEK